MHRNVGFCNFDVDFCSVLTNFNIEMSIFVFLMSIFVLPCRSKNTTISEIDVPVSKTV